MRLDGTSAGGSRADVRGVDLQVGRGYGNGEYVGKSGGERKALLLGNVLEYLNFRQLIYIKKNTCYLSLMSYQNEKLIEEGRLSLI